MGTARTEDQNEGPCAVAHEEEENGRAAPAVTQRNDELEKSEDEKDSFKGNKSDAVKE
jgi:hypothetical protein